jgi:ATP-dependent DNA helicase RecG
MEREEIPEIPVTAIREALVNSFCHRDYTRSEGNQIAIFKNRIEIYNPGSFPKGLKPEDFIKNEERSILRNPTIADILYKSKDIEKWGSGLKRIYTECKAEKVKVEFKTLKTGFMTVFYRITDEQAEKLLQDKQFNKDTIKGHHKVTIKSLQRHYKLTENQMQIIKSMQKNKYITVKNLSKIVGISDRKIKENIKKLKEYNIIKRVGPNKGGYWEIQY